MAVLLADETVCGIIGYVGSRECKSLLLQGLERLEYRGYDSAGIALLERHGLDYVRAVGPLDNLKSRAGSNGSTATTGLGHTRWATHGGVTEANAHPLAGCDASKLSIVLNGIVENYRELTASLVAEGHTFTSETDAETVTHLVERYYDGDLGEAVRLAFTQLEGHFAFVVIHHDHPGILVGARHQVPLVVGVGSDEMFLASNAAAFLRETRVVQFPGDGEIVEITPEGATFQRADGTAVEHEPTELDWDDEGAEKAGYETFMLKEIYEQPEAVAETIGDRVRHGTLVLEGLDMSGRNVKELRRIVLLACGTAYHACVVGRYVIEEWARVPVEFDIASEWIYRNPVINEHDLVIGITQSGETRDTIEALKLAREKGARTAAITNMMGSQVTREVDSVLYTRAGLEMGVAASKTFTAQVALLYLVALKLAQIRETLPPGEIEFILDFVYKLPNKIQQFLDGDHPIEEIAQRYHDAHFFLYLGRHIGLPVALEGALKLKEISYIPTEAYSAGEMKHGPIALLDEQTPVVVVATDIHVYDKIVSNIQEVRARGAHVIAIATDGNEDIQHHADDVIYVPKTPAFLQVVLAILPLQLLAYRIARLRGLNVDQPRNLAKTVTVE
ncbi:MAG: Glucosamine--fructose-6-phosphate aminotransferase (isomerizing) [Gaiellaceae bacterium]|jgi:glucosamine--fructose-6-phosphate aminotransferase (isomerizing)|nr:Glucosamine--fructose-6-phosphate aminotransferase (isomerizing) [Gaiellaceae bacterium]